MKGQKAVELAQEAVRAGAIGVTCATLYEAEVFLQGGVQGILIAHQIVGGRKLMRLARLQRHAPVIAATDSLEHAQAMSRAALQEGVVIPVVMEVDVGMNRCGVPAGEPAVALAREIQKMRGLEWQGVMGWEGHALKPEVKDRAEVVKQALARLAETVVALEGAGISCPVVSASGSGTFLHAAGMAGLTEVQAGGAVFSDVSYRNWGLDYEFALTVITRVVSRPTSRRIVVDGGFKAMSTQHGMPLPLGLGRLQHMAFSAEHGVLELAQEDACPRVGDLVKFVPGYTDSTLCLHDEICVIRRGVLEAVWVIPGRTGRRVTAISAPVA